MRIHRHLYYPTVQADLFILRQQMWFVTLITERKLKNRATTLAALSLVHIHVAKGQFSSSAVLCFAEQCLSAQAHIPWVLR